MSDHKPVALLPCPLCCGDAAVCDQHYLGAGSSGMETPWPFVICNKCGLRTVPIKCDDSPYGERTKAKSYTAAEAEAIAAWNARTPPTSAPVAPRPADGVDGLKTRLLAMYSHRGDGIPTQHVNPDGPEAVERIVALEAALGEAKWKPISTWPGPDEAHAFVCNTGAVHPVYACYDANGGEWLSFNGYYEKLGKRLEPDYWMMPEPCPAKLEAQSHVG